jgi:hypothetical protein
MVNMKKTKEQNEERIFMIFFKKIQGKKKGHVQLGKKRTFSNEN